MGGNAFKGVTRPIFKHEISDTLEYLQEIWPSYAKNGPLAGHLLGSAGKKEQSGDLDLNIDDTKYHSDIVKSELEAALGSDFVRYHPGLNQIYTAIPICGDVSSGRVQVDFMFGKYEWQKFSYYSPALDTAQSQHLSRYFPPTEDQDLSRFKGLFRTELLKAITAFCSDWVLEENNVMIARVGPTFFHDKGCVWRYRYRPFKKNSKTERVKALMEVSKEEFLALYPTAFPARFDVIDDPAELIKYLFEDSNGDLDRCKTFEGVWYAMFYSFNSSQIKTINKIFIERLNNLKIDMPTEMRQYFR